MHISKGPYHYTYQRKALTSVIHARLFNQIQIDQISLFYLVSLNMQLYLKKLTKPKPRKIRGLKKFLKLLSN